MLFLPPIFKTFIPFVKLILQFVNFIFTICKTLFVFFSYVLITSFYLFRPKIFLYYSKITMLNSFTPQQHQQAVSQHLSIEQLLRAAKLIEQRAIIEKMPSQFNELGGGGFSANFGGTRKNFFENFLKFFRKIRSPNFSSKIENFCWRPKLWPKLYRFKSTFFPPLRFSIT